MPPLGTIRPCCASRKSSSPSSPQPQRAGSATQCKFLPPINPSDLSLSWRLIVALFFAIVPFHLAAAATNETGNAVTAGPPLEVAEGFLLAIPKAGFGKDYLFSASLIPQAGAATSTGLAGKIVRFELFPDGVDMYESTRGLVVTDELPARRLLASFAIVRQDGDRVMVDFNKGMRRVFTEAWTQSGGLNLEARDTVLEVPESRVFDARQEEGRLVIRQSVQARNRQSDQNLEARYEVRYFLSPYQPGAFEGKEPEATDARYVRYFETEGHLEPVTGRVSGRIARFDLRKPVVFYYSANTPTNYAGAVQDGILYWNRAFGKEIVQAKKAPAGVTAPDAKYNLIQWVPWDNAGFAYADVLLDPLSGESQHGQAYITSVFAFEGKARARFLLRAMEELAAPKKDDKKSEAEARLGVPFLTSAPGCQVDTRAFAQQMAHGLQEVLASDALTDEAVLRVSQDYVREVVAHEVGHVLGLRHNFAGSLNTTLTRTELNDWFRAYVSGQPLDAYTNKLATSSMMEYSVFKAAVFTGWRMRTLPEPLPHDGAAIRWGYMDSPQVRTQKMLFATDQDIGRYGDVRQFDFGPDPVVNAYGEMAQIVDLLPNSVIETFIRARAPRNPHDRIPLEQVNLSFSGYASQLANQFADMISWFKAETRSLRVENQFDFIGDLNQPGAPGRPLEAPQCPNRTARRRGPRGLFDPARGPEAGAETRADRRSHRPAAQRHQPHRPARKAAALPCLHELRRTRRQEIQLHQGRARPDPPARQQVLRGTGEGADQADLPAPGKRSPHAGGRGRQDRRRRRHRGQAGAAHHGTGQAGGHGQARSRRHQ